jgi:hypothetical protein
MENSNPSDFIPLNEWYLERGKPVFNSAKLLHYHTKPIQKELIEAGAMAKVGVHLFLHKTRFWPEYQRIVALKMDGDRP